MIPPPRLWQRHDAGGRVRPRFRAARMAGTPSCGVRRKMSETMRIMRRDMGTACAYHGNSWKGMAIPNGGDELRQHAGKGGKDRVVARADTVTMYIKHISGERVHTGPRELSFEIIS